MKYILPYVGTLFFTNFYNIHPYRPSPQIGHWLDDWLSGFIEASYIIYMQAGQCFQIAINVLVIVTKITF